MTAPGAKLLAWLTGINIFIGLVDGFFKQALFEWSPAAFHGYDFFHYVALPGACALWIWRQGQVKPADLGLDRSGDTPGEGLLLGILLALVLWLLYKVAEYGFGALLANWGLFWRADFQWEQPLRNSEWRHGLAFYYAATAGLVEEVTYRGCLFRLLAGAGAGPRRSKWRFVWVSSLLFCLSHWEQGSAYMLAAGAFGLAAALIYLKLRDLWPLIIAHFLDDLVDFW